MQPPIAIAGMDSTATLISPATDLAPLLRRIFWLVHAVKTWPGQPETFQEPHTFILAAAPFNDWTQVAQQIQSDIKPETWNIERKESNGQAARTIVSLRKGDHSYEVQILPLRGFKPARFYYDYKRGDYLNLLVKAPAHPDLLHINSTGLYCQNKLVITNPADLKKFFGLTATRLDSNLSPNQFYSELVQSPFFHPTQFFPSIIEPAKAAPATSANGHGTETPQSTVPAPTNLHSPSSLGFFKTWYDTNQSSLVPLPPPAGFSIADIEERIHCINLGLQVPLPTAGGPIKHASLGIAPDNATNHA